uniref:Zinc finger PHD-type domain-containing protein n=1 Tax=Clytia hemisphaerica TaxID=252671 RepID=A0A7M5XJV2_9CNID
MKKAAKSNHKVIAPKKLVVESMSGKDDSKIKKPKDAVTGKCAVCKRIFESEEDKKFCKGKKKATEWVGCDEKNCKYWGHASCVGLVAKKKKSIKDIPFQCFQQRKK